MIKVHHAVLNLDFVCRVQDTVWESMKPDSIVECFESPTGTASRKFLKSYLTPAEGELPNRKAKSKRKPKLKLELEVESESDEEIETEETATESEVEKLASEKSSGLDEKQA